MCGDASWTELPQIPATESMGIKSRISCASLCIPKLSPMHFIIDTLLAQAVKISTISFSSCPERSGPKSWWFPHCRCVGCGSPCRPLCPICSRHVSDAQTKRAFSYQCMGTPPKEISSENLMLFQAGSAFGMNAVFFGASIRFERHCPVTTGSARQPWCEG